MKNVKRIVSLLCVVALLLAFPLSTALAEADGGYEMPFTDIGWLDEEYYNAVFYMYFNSLMNGTSETTFSPTADYTRAMFVTMLARMDDSGKAYWEGINEDNYPGTAFSDVPAGRWDAPAVLWASENGIVNGVGDGKFNPTGTITVEQFAAIVMRYMDFKGYTLKWSVQNNKGWPRTIEDMDRVSAYAKESVKAMAAANLLPYEKTATGIRINPKQGLTRMEIALLFMNVYQICFAQQSYGVEFDLPWGTVSAWVEE